MSLAKVFNARFGQTEEAYFAFTHEIADGTCNILHRHGPVDPMLVEEIDAASAAFEVGYESASQFNREYKRFFGQPPMRNVKVRRLAGSAMVSD